MFIWERKIPDYLTERKNVTSFVLFTAAFALVFINIYAPFGANKWVKSDLQYLFYSSGVILIGMLVIIVSRVFMFMLQKKRPVKYGEYAVWIVVEIFLMALVYSLVQHWFINENGDLITILKNTVRITALVILLPYVIYWLYASLRDKYIRLENLGNPEGEVLSENNGHSISSMISFYDEKGALKFSIKRNDLLYIEAADNYVIIHYAELLKSNKFILRNSLKKLENEYNLVRCHRSYVVNLERVKMLRKDREGLLIELDVAEKIALPVSKTYVDNIVKRFTETFK